MMNRSHTIAHLMDSWLLYSLKMNNPDFYRYDNRSIVYCLFFYKLSIWGVFSKSDQWSFRYPASSDFFSKACRAFIKEWSRNMPRKRDEDSIRVEKYFACLLCVLSALSKIFWSTKSRRSREALTKLYKCFRINTLQYNSMSHSLELKMKLKATNWISLDDFPCNKINMAAARHLWCNFACSRSVKFIVWEFRNNAEEYAGTRSNENKLDENWQQTISPFVVFGKPWQNTTPLKNTFWFTSDGYHP